MTDITNKEPDKEENLIFVVIKSEYDKSTDRYKIKIDKCYSTNPDLLQRAISKKAPIKETDIIDTVIANITEKIFYQL